MKKYLFIIISIIVLTIGISGTCLFLKKSNDTYYPINESKNMMQENKDEFANITPTIEEKSPSTEKETETNEVENSSSATKEETKKVSPSASTTTTPVSSDNKKTSSNIEASKKVDEKPKEEKNQVVVKTDTTPKTETPKQESKVDEIKKEEPKAKPDIERCTTNTNHLMQPGNCGKWFSTKSEAIKFYEDKIEYWDKWWQNSTSPEDDVTYYKNCPTGYEIWSCAYCSKWTINLYYR